MKSGSFLFILFLICALFSFSCKKEKNSGIIPAQISGTWQWVYTWKDIPPGPTNPVTPLNSGVTEIIVFKANRTWRKTQNNIPVDSGTYSLSHDTYRPYSGAHVFSYDRVGLYKNNAPVGWESYEVLHDTLVFNPYLSGRLSSYFVSNSGSKWFVKQ